MYIQICFRIFMFGLVFVCEIQIHVGNQKFRLNLDFIIKTIILDATEWCSIQVNKIVGVFLGMFPQIYFLATHWLGRSFIWTISFSPVQKAVQLENSPRAVRISRIAIPKEKLSELLPFPPKAMPHHSEHFIFLMDAVQLCMVHIMYKQFTLVFQSRCTLQYVIYEIIQCHIIVCITTDFLVCICIVFCYFYYLSNVEKGRSYLAVGGKFHQHQTPGLSTIFVR